MVLSWLLATDSVQAVELQQEVPLLLPAGIIPFVPHCASIPMPARFVDVPASQPFILNAAGATALLFDLRFIQLSAEFASALPAQR